VLALQQLCVKNNLDAVLLINGKYFYLFLT
jgi:hypothetical protein